MTSDWFRVLAAYLHVIGVATYLGGALVMEFVLTPAMKFVPPAQAQVMGQKSGDRYLIIAWSSLGLIALSGVLRMFSLSNEEILYPWDDLFFSSSYSRTIFYMVVLWLVLVIAGSYMTFVLRPRMAAKVQTAGGAPSIENQQQKMIDAAQMITRVTRFDLGVAFLAALLGASLGTSPFL